jgi:hypothetical protein
MCRRRQISKPNLPNQALSAVLNQLASFQASQCSKFGEGSFGQSLREHVSNVISSGDILRDDGTSLNLIPHPVVPPCNVLGPRRDGDALNICQSACVVSIHHNTSFPLSQVHHQFAEQQRFLHTCAHRYKLCLHCRQSDKWLQLAAP